MVKGEKANMAIYEAGGKKRERSSHREEKAKTHEAPSRSAASIAVPPADEPRRSRFEVGFLKKIFYNQMNPGK